MGKLVGTGTVVRRHRRRRGCSGHRDIRSTGTALESQRTASATRRRRIHRASPQTGGRWRRLRGGLQPMVDYERQIRPMLKENCLECHSQDKRKGGLSLAAYTTCSTAAAAVRWSGPAAARSLMIARVNGTVGDQMPLDELPLSDADRAPPAVDRPGRASDADLRAGARAVGSAARARRAGAAGGGLARMEPACRSARRVVPRDGARAATRARVRRHVRATGLPRHLGTAARRPRSAGLRRGSHARQARPARRDAARRRPEICRALDLVLERPAAERRRRSYFSDAERPAEHHRVADAGAPRNLPYDQFVTKLLNPAQPGDPDGFLIGVNWRGETSAAVKPWMQASQNTAQAFLGVNFKCNACHDSFVSKWKLKDAYGLAAYFSPEAKLQLYRCDIARDEYTGPRSSIRSWAGRRRHRRWPIAARPPRRSSPTRATAACRARSSIASGPGSSATASSPTPTRWTASRGVRRCSTGSRATSWSTTTT